MKDAGYYALLHANGMSFRDVLALYESALHEEWAHAEDPNYCPGPDLPPLIGDGCGCESE